METGSITSLTTLFLVDSNWISIYDSSQLPRSQNLFNSSAFIDSGSSELKSIYYLGKKKVKVKNKKRNNYVIVIKMETEITLPLSNWRVKKQTNFAQCLSPVYFALNKDFVVQVSIW